MKIFITYPSCKQIGIDSWQNFTEVINFPKKATLESVYKIITQNWSHQKDFDGEIHFKDMDSPDSENKED